MKRLLIIILLVLLPGCGTLAAFHFDGDLGIFTDWFSISIVKAEIDIYRVDEIPLTIPTLSD